VHGFASAVRSDRELRSVAAGGDLTERRLKVKVQDSYSMLSSPQVFGAPITMVSVLSEGRRADSTTLH